MGDGPGGQQQQPKWQQNNPQPNTVVQPPHVYARNITANLNFPSYMSGQYYRGGGGGGAGNNMNRRRGGSSARGGSRPRDGNSSMPQQHHQLQPHNPAPQQQQIPPQCVIQYPHYYQQHQGPPLYHLPVYQPVYCSYTPYYPEYYEEIPPEGMPPEEYYQTGGYIEGGGEYYYAPQMVQAMPPQGVVPPQPPQAVPQHVFNVHAKNFVHNVHSYPPMVEATEMDMRNMTLNSGQHIAPASTHEINELGEQQIPEDVTPEVSAEAQLPEITPPQHHQMTNVAQQQQPAMLQQSPVMQQQQPTPVVISQHSSGLSQRQQPVVITQEQPVVVQQQPVAQVTTASITMPQQQVVKSEPERLYIKTPLTATSSSNQLTIGANNVISQSAIATSNKGKQPPPPFPTNTTMANKYSRTATGPQTGPLKSVPVGTQQQPQQHSPPPKAPPVPTAADFPPPPQPRTQQVTTTAAVATTSDVAQVQQTTTKSWASLFASKTAVTATSNIVNRAVVTATQNKPVAKVSPFDSSPSPATTAPLATDNTSTQEGKISGGNASGSATKKDKQSPPPDDPASFRIGEMLKAHKLDHRGLSAIPRGLCNRSNVCYANAVLQALITIPALYNLIRSLPMRNRTSPTLIDSLVELFGAYLPQSVESTTAQSQQQQQQSGGNSNKKQQNITPTPLDAAASLKVLESLRPNSWQAGQDEHKQEDAEEFLSALLNHLNDEMVQLIKLTDHDASVADQQQLTSEQQLQQSVEEEEDENDDEWKVQAARRRIAPIAKGGPMSPSTPLSELLRGAVRSRTHRNNHSTDHLQPFFTLQLDIQKAQGVIDALEQLAGSNSSTSEGDEPWQQTWLEQLPPILCLHLKCFKLLRGHTAKVIQPVEYPIDLLLHPKILSPLARGQYNVKQRQYRLQAVIYHEGEDATKGHYLTDALHPQQGWIRYDDSSISNVSESTVLKPKAPRMPYILLYRRVDTINSGGK